MMREVFKTLILASTILTLGCGGTLTTGGDGDSDPDAPPDEVSDTTGDPGTDTAGDPGTDTADDPIEDTPTDTGSGQCSDGLDNDGDDLIDMEDSDCADPSDPVEGPDTGECTNDGHCHAGWWECDLDTNTCYEPPHGLPCEDCDDSSDCGDGVMGDDPDRDYCITYGGPWPGDCGKDCRSHYDCPRGYFCDDSPLGMCLSVATCSDFEDMGSGCGSSYECGSSYYSELECHGGICTVECTIEHDCVSGMSCVDGWCVND